MPPLLPSIIKNGFHRESYRPGDPEWLSSERAPEVGQNVKLQLAFSAELETRYANESTTWCLMGGSVDEVIAADRVRVRMTATSDHTPLGFDRDEFEAELVRDVAFENPWQLDRMFRVGAVPSPPSIAAVDFAARRQTLRIHVRGDQAVASIAALAARLGNFAVAGLPGVATPPRRRRLAHAFELAMGDLRGFETRLLAYVTTDELDAAWAAAADGVLATDVRVPAPADPTPIVRFDPAAEAPLSALAALAKLVLVGRRAAQGG